MDKFTSPEKMTVVINIQTMKKAIDPAYDAQGDFDSLWRYKVEALREMQDQLIPEYNNAVKKTYKVWLHIEEHAQGQEPKSLDDEHLPDILGTFDTVEAALDAISIAKFNQRKLK